MDADDIAAMRRFQREHPLIWELIVCSWISVLGTIVIIGGMWLVSQWLA